MKRIAPTLTATGLVGAVFGVLQWRKYTPRCSRFDLKVQFAWTDERLEQWLGTCNDRLDSVKPALYWDYLLLVGYGSFGAGLMTMLSEKGSGLSARLAVLPVIAAAADAVEDALLLNVLEVRSERLAFRAGSVLPKLVTIAATVKFVSLAASVSATGVGLTVRRRTRDTPKMNSKT